MLLKSADYSLCWKNELTKVVPCIINGKKIVVVTLSTSADL